MIRLAKLTDYGIVLMSYMARSPETTLHSARDLSQSTAIPLPTVSKLLKLLGQASLVQSQRGVRGGYTLIRAADRISVSDVVQALEGPVAMTECGETTEPTSCSIEHVCRVKPHWQTINVAIKTALEQLTLADMAGSNLPPLNAPVAISRPLQAGTRPQRKSLSLVEKETS